MMKQWIGALTLGLLGGTALAADGFPARPVTIVVPYAAGGASDGLARELAERMRSVLKQPVLVENKPGAGTTIASSYVAKAKPDGYTILFAASSFGIAPSLYPSVGYDPLKDFTPLSLLASITHVLAVNPSVPANNVDELIQWVKANPGKVNYASVGAGSTTHLEAELFKRMAGIDMTHVPYKGSSAALVDVASGRVQVMFDAYASSGPQARDGRLRILGVTTAEPSKAAPDVPTIASQGVKGFDVMTWMGLLVPTGTPVAAVETLSRAIDQALADPAFQETLGRQGFEPIGYGPGRFADYLKEDVSKWSAFIKEQNISIQ